jgi:hypothetical protein
MKAPIFLTVTGLAALVLVGAGCNGQTTGQENPDEPISLADALPDYAERNLEFGAGGDLRWLPLPKQVTFAEDEWQALPECGSGERASDVADIGLGAAWLADAVDACRDVDSGIVAYLVAPEFLTAMPGGGEACLDFCDDSHFALIDPARRMIRWTAGFTVGLRGESWSRHCLIDGVSLTEAGEEARFYCSSGAAGRIDRWYAAVAGEAEPLVSVQWVESWEPAVEYVTPDENRLATFKRQEASLETGGLTKTD